jgi:GDP-4-dehydro-6-deoxy-D-mannose reductase
MPDAALGRVIVSGAAGFAGRHLVRALISRGTEVVAPPKEEIDLRDGPAVRELVASTRPLAFFHLAAFSSPADSWQAPRDALVGNVEMSISVLESVRLEAPECCVVMVGSGQVYGDAPALPVDEDGPLRPDNPYAVSKASVDLLARQYEEAHGMDVVRMRPFNHAGPGQSDEYVVSSLARQVAEAEQAGDARCVLRTGNPDAARDFTDVRDVVRAYILAAELAGGTYNVCRGVATTVRELVEMLRRVSELPIEHEIDPARLRGGEATTLYGSPRRLAEATGWRPAIPLERTLADLISWWRERLA